MSDDKGGWRTVKGYPNYEVNKSGTVRDKSSKQVKKPWTHKRGYKLVQLFKNGEKDNVRVHRIVAAAFGAPGNGDQVDHKDGDITNNKSSNLRYATNQKNQDYRHGKKDNKFSKIKKTLKKEK